jgi:GTPase SAR1 family protein
MDTNFSGINRSFCRNASGAIFVGDLEDVSTIDCLAEWKLQVEQIIEGTPIPMILCANKVDILAQKEEEGELGDLDPLQTQLGLDEFANLHGWIGAWMCSAKDDTNIIPMMASLTRQMLIKELTENANVDESLENNRSRAESF